MLQKLLVIAGPTATGKTKLGGYLSKKFNGEIISADSRQVYKDLNIGTSKEWLDGVVIHGYDLVSPKDDFSVSKFLKFAKDKVQNIQSRNKLPIIVGGTGFYIKGLTDGIETVDIPVNNKLREDLEKLSTEGLFEKLKEVDMVKASSMNMSDKKNPRRLVRAIEISLHSKSNKIQESAPQPKTNVLVIGLKMDLNKLKERIENRIKEKISLGIKDEIKNLLDNGVKWSDQSLNTIGYKGWQGFFEGNISEDTVIESWVIDEMKYVKRQMTWFKKQKGVNWFDIEDEELLNKVEKLVEKWDNTSNG